MSHQPTGIHHLAFMAADIKKYAKVIKDGKIPLR